MATERSVNLVPLPELAPGQHAERVVACTSAHRVSMRRGRQFIAAYLRDRTGAIRAVAFDDLDASATNLARGVPVRVSGHMEIYRGRPQLNLDTVSTATAGEIATAGLVPVSYRDLGELEGFLDHLAGEVRSPGYRTLLAAFLDDPEYRADLRRSPCTAHDHHGWVGGLLEHTVAVAQLALEACAVQPRLDQDLLLTAAILHDAGHTHGFTLGTVIEPTVTGQLLGHLAIGQRLISNHAAQVPTLAAGQLDALMHCVLRHHDLGEGPLPEAAALHHINALEIAAASPTPRLTPLAHKVTGTPPPRAT